MQWRGAPRTPIILRELPSRTRKWGLKPWMSSPSRASRTRRPVWKGTNMTGLRREGRDGGGRQRSLLHPIASARRSRPNIPVLTAPARTTSCTLSLALELPSSTHTSPFAGGHNPPPSTLTSTANRRSSSPPSSMLNRSRTNTSEQGTRATSTSSSLLQRDPLERITSTKEGGAGGSRSRGRDASFWAEQFTRPNTSLAVGVDLAFFFFILWPKGHFVAFFRSGRSSLSLLVGVGLCFDFSIP